MAVFFKVNHFKGAGVVFEEGFKDGLKLARRGVGHVKIDLFQNFASAADLCAHIE